MRDLATCASRRACAGFASVKSQARAAFVLMKQRMLVLASIPVVLIAMVPMLDLRAVFNLDWINHLWLIEYFGEFFKQNGAMPRVVNTAEIVGMPTALFYGRTFYSVVGALSAMAGSALAVRLMVWTVLTLQFLHVGRTAVRLGAGQAQALALAAFVTWSIYPLTNLYNRSALTEFFAVALLTCSLMCLLAAAFTDEDAIRHYDWIAAGFFYVVAAGTHPLTAVFGGIFLAILGLVVFLAGGGPGRKFLFVSGLINVALASVVLSPWLYLLYCFGSRLSVTGNKDFNAWLFRQGGFFPDSLDNFWSRLSPVPLDLRSVLHGLKDVSTPYLEAQVALPLVVMLAWMIPAARRALRRENSHSDAFAVTCASIVLAGLAFAVSVRPSLSAWFGGMFDILQYPYRLTSYVNLGALSAVLALGTMVWRPVRRDRRRWNACLAACVGLSFAAVTLKLVHAYAIRNTTVASGGVVPVVRPLVTPFGRAEASAAWRPVPFAAAFHVDRLPTTFYAIGDYMMPDGFGSAPPSGTVPTIYRVFHIRNGPGFGSTSPMEVSVAELTLLVTDVQPFPWNRLTIDGVAVAQASTDIVSLTSGGEIIFHALSVLVPIGTHRIGFVLAEDGFWTWSNRISWLVLLLWLVIWCAAAAAQIYDPRARSVKIRSSWR